MDPFTQVIATGEGLATIADKLGILDKLKRKLMKQPDVASAKLETAFIELSKVYGILGNTVDDYLGLWLLRDEDNTKGREELAKLRRFASGRHELGMRKAKGDCKKIWSIYFAYLRPWFRRVLDKEEAEQLFSLSEN